MRALKRRLSDIVFRHMVDDAIAHTVTATLGSDMRTYTSRPVQPTVSMCSSPSSAQHDPGDGALEGLDMTAWALRDVTLELSPFITGTAAGDGDVFVLGTGDLWVWSSPLLEFSYYERQGRRWSTCRWSGMPRCGW